jgi:hypothetical protein
VRANLQNFEGWFYGTTGQVKASRKDVRLERQASAKSHHHGRFDGILNCHDNPGFSVFRIRGSCYRMFHPRAGEVALRDLDAGIRSALGVTSAGQNDRPRQSLRRQTAIATGPAVSFSEPVVLS